MSQTLMERLAEHRALGSAPANEHAWLVAHGTPYTYAAGEVVTRKGEQAKTMSVIFSGHIVIRADRGAGAQKIFEWRSGDVSGLMPYSRGASPPGDAVAEEQTETLLLDGSCFPEMIRECPHITATLVHAMVDRARQFKMADLRDEKLISLGKLAAGLAHELNNPAAAVTRSAKTLTESLNLAESAARKLAEAKLSKTQFAAIERARKSCGSSQPAGLSAVARADREDTIADWLADHGASDEAATTLADTGVTLQTLDELAGAVSDDALDASVQWLAACCTVRSLASEIEMAGARISNLVSSVKGFSFMDHAPKPEPVDIRKGIDDALVMLGGKTRGKSVEISVDFEDALPRAQAVGAELNLVWMNLLDNALDAVPDGGHVSVTARHELNCVVVRIVDDGPGIPQHIRDHIFEPFFTTKGVGKGTGLGLDIVKRMLQRHDAEVDVESEPGRTEFQVRLPVGR